MRSRKSYACNRCLRRYTDKNLLRAHKQEHGQLTQGRLHHNIDDSNICPYCSFRFAGSGGVGLHLIRNKRCSVLHENWEKSLAATVTSRVSSAAPSVADSDSSSHDSDNFDDPVQVPGSDSDSNQGESRPAELERMDVDADAPVVAPSSPAADQLPENEDFTLVELIDPNGNVVFAEQYPNQSAGQPIRRTKPEDLPASYRKYPDVGSLSNPECFEVTQLLMESGVSGRFRNRYLTLKRIKDRMPWKNDRAMLIDVDKLPHGPA
ncbi:hypothetical protein RhiJN_17380 [Ceratobasidium sp. AG-Ba]|nr:hypothetical protein RhiJN_17380 [Ceratobasidium sp. AG-Ba]